MQVVGEGAFGLIRLHGPVRVNITSWDFVHLKSAFHLIELQQRQQLLCPASELPDIAGETI